VSGLQPSPAEIASYARQHLACETCGAEVGQPCARAGRGGTVHKPRYISAAIAVKRAGREARRTPEEAAILASLPRIPKAEIEACKTSRGGYSFTRAWFLEHGLPYPPVPGWRAAVEREDGEDTGTEGAR
jgi:hypothetical protein